MAAWKIWYINVSAKISGCKNTYFLANLVYIKILEIYIHKLEFVLIYLIFMLPNSYVCNPYIYVKDSTAFYDLGNIFMEVLNEKDSWKK